MSHRKLAGLLASGLSCSFILSLGFSASLQPHASPSVVTSQYDNARTGANSNEAILKPANVNPNQFGKLFSLPVDGDIYAQPLFLPQVNVPGKGKHNIVFVATEHDSVYAYDADNPAGQILWHVNFLNAKADITTLSTDEVRCPFIVPEVGITSTPAINAAGSTIYVLARTKERAGFVQRLHALDVATGKEKFGGPVEIRAAGFNSLLENPRAALLLSNGVIYLGWASSCDVGPYHGWLMAYDAQTLQQLGAFSTSPNSDQSGIWAADTGPAADAAGNVYVATGNGKFDVSSGGHDYGDTLLKLTLSSHQLTVRDYFTPYNQEYLNKTDADLGSGGPVLLPEQPGPHSHLVLIGGKGATLYLVDCDHMGKFHPNDDSYAVQTIRVAADLTGAPGYWNGHVFVQSSGDVLKDYALKDGRLSAQPVAQDSVKSVSGATPSISSDGANDGIVWLIESKGWDDPDQPAILHAYAASNVGHELYNSNQNAQRDRAGRTLRFTIPTVVNGRVYVDAKKELDVYGLLALAGH
jgi:hypothetical protein